MKFDEERETKEKRMRKRKRHTRASYGCTALMDFAQNCLDESALLWFWLMASNNFYRLPTAKRRNRILWHCALCASWFQSSALASQTIIIYNNNNKKRYSCGDNLINAFRILFNEFVVRSVLFTLLLNFLIELNGDHITNLIKSFHIEW